MKNSFLDSWRDVAGLYKRRKSQTDFAIVVRLPPDVPYASLIGLPIAGALAGLPVGYLANRLTRYAEYQIGRKRGRPLPRYRDNFDVSTIIHADGE